MGFISAQTQDVSSGSASFTIPTGCTFVLAAIGHTSGAPYSGVTIGGAAMTAVDAVDNTDSLLVGMAFKAAPATGAQTFALSSVAAAVKVTLFYYNGIDAGAPIRDSAVEGGNYATSFSIDVTSVAGDLIADVIVVQEAGTITEGGSQAPAAATTVGSFMFGASSQVAVGTTTASSWSTSGGGQRQAHIAVALVPAAAESLVIDDQPSTTASGYPIDPPVIGRLTTDGTTTDTGATDDVTVELIGSGGALYGTLVVAAVAGVFSFDELVPCIAGTYVLRFSATGYTTVDSEPFTVTSGGGSTVIVSRGFMNSRPTRRNEPTASLRRILLYIEDDAGAPWAGSVTDVKAMLTVNGTLISSEETEAPADIVRIAGGLHYTDVTQPYTDIAEGSFITARLPAASGRREAASTTEIIPADSYAAVVAEAALVRSIIRAAHGLDGYAFAKSPTTNKLLITIPSVGTIEVDATFSLLSPAIDSLGG